MPFRREADQVFEPPATTFRRETDELVPSASSRTEGAGSPSLTVTAANRPAPAPVPDILPGPDLPSLAEGPPEPGLVSDFRRGVARARQGAAVLARETGQISDEEAAEAIGLQELEASRFPRKPEVEEGLRDIIDAEGVIDTTWELITNPQAVLSVVAESLPLSGPSMGGAIAGGATGSLVAPGPGTIAGIAAGAGVPSAAVEYAVSMTDYMREQGVDPTDREAIVGFFSDPGKVSEAREFAAKRGIPIGLFDALSAGLAGRIAGPVAQATRTAERPIAGAVVGGTAELAAQAGAGAGGEAAAQIVSEGEITEGGEIALEAAGEIVPGVVEIGVGRVFRGRGDTVVEEAPPTTGAPEAAPEAPLVLTEEVPQEAAASRVVTPQGREVDTRFEVVEAGDLITSNQEGFPAELQPRDRDRATSDIQIAQMAQSLDPNQLGDSRLASTGAPIISDDANFVESGNARVAAIRRAYEGAMADEYRAFIERAGFDTAGMDRPVLVRRRSAPFATPDERLAFVREANESAVQAMSPTEQAISDARSITSDMLARFQGGEITQARNRAFVRDFLTTIGEREAAGLVSPDGSLNQQGLARVRNALFARAYEDPGIVQALAEDTDSNIRAITGGLEDAAPSYATLRSEIDAGSVRPEMDITPNIIQAAQIVSDARRRGRNVEEITGQIDLFGQEVPAETRAILSAMSGLRNRQRFRNFMVGYAEAAREAAAGPQLPGFEETVARPLDILNRRLQLDGLQPVEELAVGAPVPQAAPERPEGRGEVRERVSRAGPGRRGAEVLEDRGRGAVEEREASGGGRAGGGRRKRAGRVAGAPKTRTRKPRPKAPIPPTLTGDEFVEASFTNRRSFFEQVYRDAGYSPDEVANMPPERQYQIASKQVKETFGLHDITRDPSLQIREAIDQLMDAYRNLKFQAAALGISDQAIGLPKEDAPGGTLTLHLQKRLNYLGAYSPTTGEIRIPRRSNSFGHEWAHALDYYVMEDLGLEKFRGITGAIRTQGESFTPGSVSEAFVRVVNAMFFDQAEFAMRLMKLEAQLAKAKTDKSRDRISKQIENMKRGNSKALSAASDFYKNAVGFDGGTGYWTRPTEMFARAFEAYLADRTENQGGTNEFIGKGNLQYSASAHERFANTFPRNDERAHIFAAFDDLFDTLVRAQILQEDASPADARVGDADIMDPKVWDRFVKPNTVGNVIKNEAVQFMNDVKRSRFRQQMRPRHELGLWQRIKLMLMAPIFAMDSNFRYLERLYPQSDTLKRMANMFVTMPGSGRQVGTVYDEGVDMTVGKYSNRLANIIKRFKLDAMEADQNNALRDALLGVENTQITPEIREAAAAIRRSILDELYYYQRSAGVELGFVENSAYLPRVVDTILSDTNPEGFLGTTGVPGTRGQDGTGARAVYGIMWDDAVGFQEGAYNVDNFLELTANLGWNDGWTDAMAEGRRDVQGYRQDLRKIDKDLADGTIDADTAADQQADILEKLNTLMNQLVPEVREVYATAAAEDWQQRTVSGSANEWGNRIGNSKHTGKRSLPPEADKLMQDFYIQDVEELLIRYVNSAAHTAEWTRRMGANGKAGVMSGMTRDEMRRGLSDEGVPREHIDYVFNMIDSITGRQQSTLPPWLQRGLGVFHGISMIALLPRATLSSLAEAATIGIQSESVKRSFQGLTESLSTDLWSLAKTKNSKHRQELAQALGIVSDALTQQMISNRYAFSWADNPQMSRLLGNFYRRIGMVALTNAQRTSAVGIGYAYLKNIAQRHLDAGGTAGAEVAAFRDLGIGDRDMDAFAEWIIDQGSIPTIDDLDNQNGRLFATAIMRFVNQSIQSPKAYNRPYLANNPVGRVIYGISGFNYAFWGNVIKRSARRIGTIGKTDGVWNAARVSALGILPSFVALYILQTTVNAGRQALLSTDRWEEERKKDNLIPWLMGQGFSRSGFFGPIGDMLANAWLGLKYQRDLSNIFVGPGTNYFMQGSEKMAQPFVRNSENTNTAEYRGWQGFYQTIISPALAVALAWVPGGGPLLTSLYGLGEMTLTSSTASNVFAEQMAGKKGTRAKSRAKPRGGSRGTASR